MNTAALFFLSLFLGLVSTLAMLFADGVTGFALWFWRVVAIGNAVASLACIGLVVWRLAA